MTWREAWREFCAALEATVYEFLEHNHIWLFKKIKSWFLY